MIAFFVHIYHTLSLIKILVGIVVLILVGMYIDPFQDPQTGIIIWSIGLLFLIWWVSYFIFYFFWVKWTDHKLQMIASSSYKSSLLIALYMMTNIIFIIVEFRSIFHALILTFFFVWLYRFLFYWPKPEKHMSIDMLQQHKETEASW